MSKKQDLLSLIESEVEKFNNLKSSNKIVPNSVPIVWFGDSEKYFNSSMRIITVSLNPSLNEFKETNSSNYTTKYRFPAYKGTLDSLFNAYNEYYTKQPYGGWFKASFSAVLQSFNASHYSETGARNTALHTDIGSSYATNPTWSGLKKPIQSNLEPLGSASWHALMKILEPDLILFSASKNYERKILFKQIGEWKEFNVKASTPLLSGKFQIVSNKQTSVLFQIQGRKPFLRTTKEEKLKFNKYI